MELSGKVAVVTGAGSGIGRALAIDLANRGCKLALNDYSQDNLNATFDLISHIGEDKILLKSFDVGDWKIMQQFASETYEYFGQIDLMINNAGVALGSYLAEDVTLEDFKWLMDVNFWGMVYGSKAFLPFLKKSEKATLVNISSVLGLVAIAKQTPYCSSKFAIRGFTESLRMEAMMEFPHVNVLCVHPGGIKTNIAQNSKWDSSNFTEEERQAMRAEFEKSFINTPAYAAEVIVKAILKDKQRVLIGKDARWMSFLGWLFPIRYTKIMIKDFMSKYDLETKKILESKNQP